MDNPTITLLSFAHFGSDFLEKISAAVQYEFQCEVAVKEMHIDLSEFFDNARRQYNGDKLLKAVDQRESSDMGKTIGLFNVDLFIPILTYIFGQAQLGGRTGIASLYRLSNEPYGILGNDDYLLERFKKEVIHELGHLFGLVHCHTPTCVMRSSTYVEDIDQKDAQLCVKCRAQI
jgi:archaemetzincin